MRCKECMNYIMKQIKSGRRIFPYIGKNLFDYSDNYDTFEEFILDWEHGSIKEDKKRIFETLREINEKFTKGDYDGIDFYFNMYASNYVSFYYYINKVKPYPNVIFLPCIFKYKNIFIGGCFELTEKLAETDVIDEYLNFIIYGIQVLPEKYVNDEIIELVMLGVEKRFDNEYDYALKLMICFELDLTYDDYFLEEIINVITENEFKRNVVGNFILDVHSECLFADLSVEEIYEEGISRFKHIFESD